MIFPTPTQLLGLPAGVRDEIQALIPKLAPPVSIDVPYDASNFEARNGMTWTVDPSRIFSFYFRRETPTRLFVSFLATATVIGGTPENVIRIRIPDGRIAARTEGGVGSGNNTGSGNFSLRVITTAGDRWISIFREDVATWNTGNATVAFQLFFDVLPLPA